MEDKDQVPPSKKWPLGAFFSLCPHHIVLGMSNYINLPSFMLVSYFA